MYFVLGVGNRRRLDIHTMKVDSFGHHARLFYGIRYRTPDVNFDRSLFILKTSFDEQVLVIHLERKT